MSFPVSSGNNLIFRAEDIAQSDSSTVTTWSDTSGNGYNLTLTGSARLALTGGNDALPFVYMGDVDNDIFDNASYPVNKRACSFLVILDYLNLSTTHYTVTLGGSITFMLSSDGTFKKNAVSFSQGTPPSGKRVAILVTLGASDINLYLDSSSNVSSISAESAGSITGFSLGGSGPLFAKIYEVRGFSRELNSTEIADILDTWAPATYGTGASLSPTARIITDGDSITQGTGATKSRSWPYYLNPGDHYIAHNYGVSGNTWASLIARQAVTDAYASSSNWLIVYCGTNDLAAGRTGAQLIADFQTYMGAAVSAGFDKSKIVATTCHLNSHATDRDTFNTWLRSNYTTYSGYLFDLAADSDLGIGVGTYLVDGVHFNDAGYVLYASKVASLIGSPWNSVLPAVVAPLRLRLAVP